MGNNFDQPGNKYNTVDYPSPISPLPTGDGFRTIQRKGTQKSGNSLQINQMDRQEVKPQSAENTPMLQRRFTEKQGRNPPKLVKANSVRFSGRFSTRKHNAPQHQEVTPTKSDHQSKSSISLTDVEIRLVRKAWQITRREGHLESGRRIMTAIFSRTPGIKAIFDKVRNEALMQTASGEHLDIGNVDNNKKCITESDNNIISPMSQIQAPKLTTASISPQGSARLGNNHSRIGHSDIPSSLHHTLQSSKNPERNDKPTVLVTESVTSSISREPDNTSLRRSKSVRQPRSSPSPSMKSDKSNNHQPSKLPATVDSHKNLNSSGLGETSSVGKTQLSRTLSGTPRSRASGSQTSNDNEANNLQCNALQGNTSSLSLISSNSSLSPQHDVFSTHANLLVQTIDEVINGLAQLLKTERMLYELGVTHSRILKGLQIDSQYWNIFGEVIFEQTFFWGALAAREVRNTVTMTAWMKIVIFIVEKIREGYDDMRRLKFREKVGGMRRQAREAQYGCSQISTSARI